MRVTDRYVLFWSGVFSQWHKVKFIDCEGREFSSAEQFMFFHKAKLFNDQEILEKVMKTSDPKKQKQLGRKVKGFNEAIWDEYKELIVFLGNYYKFSQNDDLKQEMIQYEQYFVEASPVDSIWGIGLHFDDLKANDPDEWRGQNLLGKALNKVKNVIKEKDFKEVNRIEGILYN